MSSLKTLQKSQYHIKAFAYEQIEVAFQEGEYIVPVILIHIELD